MELHLGLFGLKAQGNFQKFLTTLEKPLRMSLAKVSALTFLWLVLRTKLYLPSAKPKCAVGILGYVCSLLVIYMK